MNETLTFNCADGETITGTLFTPDSAPKGAVLIASALATPRKVYAGLAEFLAESGYAALTFDYRATFGSRSAGNGQSNLQDWGEQDIDAALSFLADRFPGKPLFHLGHSVGAQLFGLAPNSAKLAGAILVTPSLPHLSRFPLKSKLGIAAVWRVAIPLLTLGRDRFPANRLGMSSEDMPTGAMKQWAEWASKPDYLFTPDFGLDTSSYSSFAKPLLSFGFSDDSYAPENVSDAFLQKLPNANIKRRYVNVPELAVGGMGHFGFFKGKAKPNLWAETIQWLNKVTGD